MSAFKYLLVDSNGVICGTNDEDVVNAAVETDEYTVQTYANIDEIEGFEALDPVDSDDLEDD